MDNTEQHHSKTSYELNLNDDEQAVAFIERYLRDGRARLREWSAWAKYKMRLVDGEHDIMFDRRTHMMQHDPRFDSEIGYPEVWRNYLRQFKIDKETRIIEADTTWRVAPMTGEPADVQAASALNVSMPLWWRSANMDNTASVQDALYYLNVCNLVFAQPEWAGQERFDRLEKSDAEAYFRSLMRSGEIEESNDFDSMFTSFEGTLNEHQKKWYKRGDNDSLLVRSSGHRLTFRSPFDVIEDMGCPWDKSEVVAIRESLSLSQATKKWGAEAIKGLRTKPLAVDGEDVREDKFDIDDTSSNTDVFEKLDVWYFYVTHDYDEERYPKGKCIAYCDGKILRNADHPYDHGLLPLVRIVIDPAPNKLRPTGPIDDMIVLQRAANEYDQLIAHHTHQTVHAGYLVERGSVGPNFGIRYQDTHQYTTRNNTLRPPERKQYPDIPAYVGQHLESLIQAMRDLGGITDPSIGQANPQLTSGRQILALNARNDRMNAGLIRGWSDGMAAIGAHFIALFAQYRKEAVRIYGESGGTRGQATIVGESLAAAAQNRGRPASSKWDVKVQLGEVPNEERTVQEIATRLQFGVWDAVLHRSVIGQSLAAGRLVTEDVHAEQRGNAYDESDFILSLATSYNTIEEAVPNLMDIIPVRIGDDHETHLSEHFRFASDRSRLSDLEPHQVDLYFALVAHHAAQHQQQMQLQVMNQNAASGGSNGVQQNGRQPQRTGNNGSGSTGSRTAGAAT